VRFAGVYPGVDLLYYGNQRQLEYDFVVAPGANVSAITLGLVGATGLEINRQGELVLQTQAGEVRWKKPVVYQEVGGVKHTVDGRYVLRGTKAVGFQIDSFNPQVPLVIDPVLVYSTYLGAGPGAFGKAIAVDSAGHAYVAGSTFSINTIATAGARQIASGGGQDAFVTKFDTTRFGKAARVYSTYLGGNGTDAGNGIAVDSAGNAYVAGTTGSTNFPTFNPYQSAFQGGPGGLDVFVAKLNPSGNGLLYSTYLGGDHNDVGTGIAVDSSDPADGYAYVTGNAISSNFPTLNAFQGSGFGFVAKLNTLVGGVPSLVYSTYLDDDARAIAADVSGHAYVTGHGGGAGITPTLCLEPFCPTSPDAFVTKIDTTASGATSLVYTSYVGGGADDIGLSIAVDAAGNTYVTGVTSSIDFPGTSLSAIPANVSAILGANAGGNDAFVFKLNASGHGLMYSTYLGGTGSDDEGLGIAVDSFGNAFVTGITNSIDFPIRNPLPGQASLGGANAAFVTKINASGTSWEYSTYLGGSSSSSGSGIALDSAGDAFITGNTGAPDFPLVDPFVFSLSGSDAFVAEISEPAPTLAGIAVTPANASTARGATLQFTATGTFSDGSTQNLTNSVTWSSDTPSVATISAGGLSTGVSIGTSLITAMSGSVSGSTALTVAAPPSIAKEFGATAIPIGDSTSLTFTIGNPNSIGLSGVAFTDTLPAGLIIATPNGLNGSCNDGVVTTGSGSVTLTGGTLAPNSTCVFSVNVTGNQVGSWTNVTGNIRSIEGGTGSTATAAIAVQNPEPNCVGRQVVSLSRAYGNLKNAAVALGFTRVQALVDSVAAGCGR
jgi:uncharacterized repeat protein (TIGR01451 family)